MRRGALFQAVRDAIRLADYCDRHGLPTREGVERARAEGAAARQARLDRRAFMQNVGAAGAVGAVAACAPETGVSPSFVRPSGATADVAIVGAGLAGVACATELQRAGVTPTLYEGSTRVGGRQWSMGEGFPGPVSFPGQTVERGGELIDTSHATMKGYARDLGLSLEHVTRNPGGEVFYYFNGQRYAESVVVDEFRAFVSAMRPDLRTVGSPTANNHTASDEALDRVTLKQYLDSRGAGPIAKKAIDVAYNIEFGLETDQQSSLAFLLYIRADRRSRFQPFGSSDERFHVVSGNEGIVRGLHNRLTRPAQLGQRLVRVRKTAAGRIELTFTAGSSTVVRTHDLAVITLPFSTLRQVELDPSLALPEWKLRAIRELRYGTNAKLMVGFNGTPWRALGNNGTAYSDLANHQSNWETNPTRATGSHGVLTDYTGSLGGRMNPNQPQVEAARFLTDLDRIYPGALAAATRDTQGRFLAHLEHWPSNPFSLGSYTANHPGYFTTVADLEGLPVGNLFFAGEHTSSFYEYQGFMEGACNTGIRAASEVLASLGLH